jgi:hypothetical protein
MLLNRRIMQRRMLQRHILDPNNQSTSILAGARVVLSIPKKVEAPRPPRP